MTDRYSRPKQRSWFVPTLVVVGIAAFFLWESGWRPFEVLDVPTGTVNTEGQQAVATNSLSDEDYSLPEITPEQFEPDTDDLNPDELSVGFNVYDRTTEAPTTSGVKQAGFAADSTGDNTFAEFDMADFADAAPPADLPEPTNAAPLAQPVPRPTGVARPIVTPELSAKLNRIDFLLEENDFLTAHKDLSTLYWYEPKFREVFRDRLQHTAKSIYAAPQPHYMKPYVVQPGDTLAKIAAKYDVPWTYLSRLNNVEANRVRTGSKLKVIRGPFGAVVDLSDFELTIHAHGYYVRSYKVGIGKGQSTPIGEFKVQNKLENPVYYPPEGGTVAADDPTNPLGEHWLGIGDGYGIHGTIDPNSIGKAESKGCIRLATGDIEEVFDLLTNKSTIMIRR